jgi:ribosomal protein L11 methyltransferase
VIYLRPESEIHIYLLSGVFPGEDESFLGNSFIGNWVEGESSFLFFSAVADSLLEGLLSERGSLVVVDQYRFAYKDWQGGGIDPVRVGKFLILPPWDGTGGDGSLIEIRLDPGVVFGNGLHPTTRDCLSALSFAWEHRPFERLLDLGTGTGILAIASALLGANEVTALDLNPLCVKTAARNALLNGVEGRVRVLEGEAEGHISTPCDLVVANIHHEVISRLFEMGGFKEKGRVILSGLLRSQWGEVREKLLAEGFEILRLWDFEMTWYTALVERGWERESSNGKPARGF